MRVRRQIYLTELDDQFLRDRSRASGLSVSELIRRAIRQSDGPDRRLSWEEIFAHPLVPQTDAAAEWIYEPLFDDDDLDDAALPHDNRHLDQPRR